MNNSEEVKAQLASLKTKLEALEAERNSGHESEEEGSVRTKYETLLVKSWMDENGLLTGALPYIAENIKGVGLLGRTFNNDAYLRPDFTGEKHDFVEDVPQIALFRQTRKNRSPLLSVMYQNTNGHHITINQYEAVIRVTEQSTPYKVYRPFLNPDGTFSFKLVREVVVVKHDVDQVPAYLNYLLVKIDGRIFTILQERQEFDDDVWHDMFMEHALGPRRLPNFNDIQTPPEVAGWFVQFMALLNAAVERGPDISLDEIADICRRGGETFRALTESVVFSYNELELVEEATTEDTDIAVENVDASTVVPEVSYF